MDERIENQLIEEAMIKVGRWQLEILAVPSFHNFFCRTKASPPAAEDFLSEGGVHRGAILLVGQKELCPSNSPTLKLETPLQY